MPEARVVKTSIDGLDLVLGGGVRLLERVEGAGDSATLLVRGAAGTGKTILAHHIAAALAKKLECDVAVACVELLPPELEAQLAGFDATSPLLPVRGNERVEGRAPRVFARVIQPDLTQKDDPIGDEVQRLLDGIELNGGVPRVLVVDSLSDGYGIGGKVERVAADALARLAAARGLCLILVEEVQQLRPSPWCFAVDAVIELRLERFAGSLREERTLTVTKNRFGPSDAGPHELALGGRQLMVLPEPDAWDRAWAGGWWSLAVTRAEGTRSWGNNRLDELVEKKMLSPFEASVTLVRASDPVSAAQKGHSLGAIDPKADGTVVKISLRGDGTLLRGALYGDALVSAHRLQAMFVERLRAVRTAITQVVIGDLSALHDATLHTSLMRAIARTVGWLSAAQIPVILYETAPARLHGHAAGVHELYEYENVVGASLAQRFGEGVILEFIPKSLGGNSKMPPPRSDILVSDLGLRTQNVL
jgi:KaiC/GvpD/RAD55 family RecA-like ATPase